MYRSVSRKLVDLEVQISYVLTMPDRVRGILLDTLGKIKPQVRQLEEDSWEYHAETDLNGGGGSLG
jgi:hypothetical protein